MDVLSIGNSFSRDAQRYIHDIARADGCKLNTCNLYIGGCPLSKHYRNMLADTREYGLDVNGDSTGFEVSIKEALLSRDWDVVTLQQASSSSINYDTYQPYLDKLAEYVRLCVPKAKIVIHQTWAYEEDCERLKNLGYTNQADMYSDLKTAYEKAAADIRADFVIPSGEVFQKLIAAGIEKVHRDTFHASLGLGRFTLGLLWYAILTGNDVRDNTFCDFDEEVSPAEIEIAKKCVYELINGGYYHERH